MQVPAIGLATWALLLAGCHQPMSVNPVAAKLGDPFTLGVGQVAELAETRVRVALEDVTADSRCPSDVQCVWAGNAAMRVRVTGDTDFVVVLNTTVDPRARRFGQYELRVEQLEPLRSSSAPITRKDYRATFVVSRP